jgi:hypothetical protein
VSGAADKPVHGGYPDERGPRRWVIRECEYPGCDLITQDGHGPSHSHPHRTMRSPPYTETPLGPPITVVPEGNQTSS